MVPKLIQMAQNTLFKYLSFPVLIDTNIYLPGNQSKLEIPPCCIELDGQVFTLTACFSCVYLLSANVDLHFKLLQQHLRKMFRALQLQRIGHSLFNPKIVIEHPIMGVNIWPGY